MNYLMLLANIMRDYWNFSKSNVVFLLLSFVVFSTIICIFPILVDIFFTNLFIDTINLSAALYNILFVFLCCCSALILILYLESHFLRAANYRLFVNLQLRFYKLLLQDQLRSEVARYGSPAKLILHFTDDVVFVREFVSLSVVMFFKNLMIIFGMIAFMLRFDIWLALMMCCSIFGILPSIMIIVNRYKFKTLDVNGVLSSYVCRFDDVLKCIKSVKSLGGESHELSVAKEVFNKLFALYSKIARVESILAICRYFFLSLFAIVIFWYSVRIMIAHKITIGVFFALITSCIIAAINTRAIATNYKVIIRGLAAAERIYSLFSICENDVINGNEIITNVSDLEDFDVKFEKVTYGDDIDENGSLNCVDFIAQRGRIIGILGCTSHEKSSIVDILLRLKNYESGIVSIGGCDIKNISLDTIKSVISFISKDVFLFDGTIRANILYGNLNATKNDIIKATRLAHAHGFISELNDEYETIIGNNGVKLTESEKKRIIIARVFLRNAPILILDDVLLVPDSESEYLVNAAISNLMRDRTVIIVANNFYSVMNASTIYVMVEGVIVEQGTHRQLVRDGGIYANLYERGVSEFDELH